MTAVAAPSAPRSRDWLQQFGLVFVVLLLGVTLSVAGHINRRDASRPNLFLNKANLVENVATPMSYYAIMAVGLTVVIVSGGIDISVGSIMALSAMLTTWALQRPSGSPASAWSVLPIAIGLPILIGATCGLINGVLIVGLRIYPFIITLGTLGIFRCAATVVPPTVALPQGQNVVPAAFTDHLIKLTMWDVRVVPLVITLIVVALGTIYLRLFVYGANTYAVGGNEEAARLAGIHVGRTKIVTYVISGACAGVAGMISVGNYGSATAVTANGYELMVVAAAVVGGASLTGGRGTAIGAMLGALIIGLIESGIIIMRWDVSYRLGIVGAAIILAVALDRLSETLSGRSKG